MKIKEVDVSNYQMEILGNGMSGNGISGNGIMDITDFNFTEMITTPTDMNGNGF